MSSKRGQGGLIAIIIIIIIIFFLGWLINEGWKECRSDRDCENNQYCTSSFECKDIPDAQGSREPMDLTIPAIIIGIAIIIAAIIFRWTSLFGRKKKAHKEPKKRNDGYIDLGKGHNSEPKGLYQEDIEEQS